jgi:hypothetical protein
MTTRSIPCISSFRGLCARLFIAFCFVMLSSVAFSQTTAGVTGVVTDSTGSVMPGATVTLTSTETGAQRVFTTIDTGAFVFTELQPGFYTLTLAKSGFDTEKREGIRLELNQTARIDVVMRPGTVSESVEVNSAVPLLEATTSSEFCPVGDSGNGCRRCRIWADRHHRCWWTS